MCEIFYSAFVQSFSFDYFITYYETLQKKFALDDLATGIRTKENAI